MYTAADNRELLLQFWWRKVAGIEAAFLNYVIGPVTIIT